MHSERAPLFLKVAAWGGVIFLHFPLLIIAIYAFNTEEAAFSFPPQGLTLKSFGDLLAHPHPPVELLKVTKDFAKACRLSPRGALPKEIATVLYFASIAAAMVRCRRRITGLSDADLADGLRWTLARPWLDAPTRSLIEEGLALLTLSVAS